MKIQKHKRDSIVASVKDLELQEKLDKILRRVQVEPEKQCWLLDEDWTKICHIEREAAHRWIFKVFKGPIEEGLYICHHCDRPGCINSEHLYQGTAKDNFQDAIKRGRYIRSRVSNKVNPLELDRLARLNREKNLQLPIEYWKSSYAYGPILRRRIQKGIGKAPT